MKKLFTLTFILSILVTTLGVRANAQETMAEDENDNSYLTIEVIENSFWEELESFKYPKITKEDEYLNWLIDGICEPKITIPAFGDIPYINFGLGLRKEKINLDRFVYKCQRIIDLYNHTHDLQLTMKIKVLSSESLQIDVKQEKPEFIENMVTLTGQLAHVKEDTIYWESAQYFGSGKNGITKTKVVQVNGVAYLDENGDVVSSYYGTAPEQIERWALRMLHICTEEGDLGWVYPTQLTCIDE